MPVFTEDQIQTLAPDAASLKAGKDLATARKWPVVAANQRVLWGEAQGSGKDPYRTQIDLTTTAFACSCPSRKFPCKHGLGLLLLYCREPNLFASIDEPDWVSSWINKRVAKASKSPEPPTESASTKTDAERKEQNQQKRLADRQSSIQAGVAELNRWQEDLIRTGLLTLPEKSATFWQSMASRMVDAKAPGLANRVRQLGQLPFYSGNAWQSDALRLFGQLHLLTRAFSRLDQLPADLQADVKSAVGLTINQKDLLDSPAAQTLTDRFLVLARQTSVDDDLTVQRNYLLGQRSGRFALVVNFAFKNTPMPPMLPPGAQTEAKLVFYPSRWPYRALLATQSQVTEPSQSDELLPLSRLADWSMAQQALTDVLSLLPWADDIPQLVDALSLITVNDQHYLRDANSLSQSVDPDWSSHAYYQFLALSGGMPVPVFVVRQESHVLPLGIWVNEGYYSL